jgi:hypothetical protein
VLAEDGAGDVVELLGGAGVDEQELLLGVGRGGRGHRVGELEADDGQHVGGVGDGRVHLLLDVGGVLALEDPRLAAGVLRRLLDAVDRELQEGVDADRLGGDEDERRSVGGSTAVPAAAAGVGAGIAAGQHGDAERPGRQDRQEVGTRSAHEPGSMSVV